MIPKWCLCLILIALAPTLWGGDGKDPHPGLMDPSKATEKAPDNYRVKFTTTKGDVVFRVVREWSPIGADRFYNLVRIGYFNRIGFYRVVTGFVVQFGFSGDPKVNKVWSNNFVKDDPQKMSNSKGRLVFANRGPNTRSTQLFINTRDNPNLDPMGFTPFGEVEGEGMAVIAKLYAGYGEGPPYGPGPVQRRLEREGNAYLEAEFPKLDFILSAEILPEK